MLLKLFGDIRWLFHAPFENDANVYFNQWGEDWDRTKTLCVVFSQNRTENSNVSLPLQSWSHQLLTGVPWKLLQTSMFPRAVVLNLFCFKDPLNWYTLGHSPPSDNISVQGPSSEKTVRYDWDQNSIVVNYSRGGSEIYMIRTITLEVTLASPLWWIK